MPSALAETKSASEALGARILKVDHAGEHGAVCIYSAQIAVCRWRAPALVPELEEFLNHELRHRALFGNELARRGRRRCRSYHFCGLGGLTLGLLTGLAGPQAVHATTAAIERVVLAHMREQIRTLADRDAVAHQILSDIVEEEQEHHDKSEAKKAPNSAWARVIDPVVSASTEFVIWLGMKF